MIWTRDEVRTRPDSLNGNMPIAPGRRRAVAKSAKARSRQIAAQSGPPVVVGIGASAGGLEALKAFFGAMPHTTGLAFVVVVHLDPAHDSLMAEVLAKSTKLPVAEAHDRQRLEADHVYVIPPNHLLTIEQGRIRLREVSDRLSLRGVIDQFLRSLAQDRRDRAVGIILSGSASDGTSGLRAIKAEGGLVMAQTPETASQSGMPSSAIATGLVDVVLPPHEMPAALDADRGEHALSIARPARRPSRRSLSTTSMQCWRSSTFGTRATFGVQDGDAADDASSAACACSKSSG